MLKTFTTGGNSMHHYGLRAATCEDQSTIQALIQQVLAEYDLSLDLPGTDQDLQNLEGAYFGMGGYFGVVLNAQKQIMGTYYQQFGFRPFQPDDNCAARCDQAFELYLPARQGEAIADAG